MASKQENERKRSLARSLFMSGMEMTEIADKVDVSRVTISNGAQLDGWKEARAAKTITRPELVNMLLSTIHKLLVQVGDADDPASAAGLADKLSNWRPSLKSSIKRPMSSMPSRYLNRLPSGSKDGGYRSGRNTGTYQDDQ